MNYSEVQALVKAGFTAQEIRDMLNPQIPQDNPQADPELEEPEVKPEEPEVKPEEVPEDHRFEELNNTMTKILKAIQGNNLQNSSFNSPAETDINKEVDKIMGSLIRPERQKGE